MFEEMVDIKCCYWSRGCRRAVVILPEWANAPYKIDSYANPNGYIYPPNNTYPLYLDNTYNDSSSSR